MELIDLAATLVELGGGVPPADWDSRSLVPVLEDPRTAHRPHTVAQLAEWRSITDRRWKLVLHRQGAPRLHDLIDDPAERRSVAGDHPDVVARLTELCDAENPWQPGPGATGGTAGST